MTDACAWNLNAFCFISRDVFFGSRGCRDTFSHIAFFPAATADRARNTTLVLIGRCRALHLVFLLGVCAAVVLQIDI